jgi:hypothetical protein
LLGARRALPVLALAVAAATGCARTRKQPDQAAPQPSADPALAICAALSTPGPLATRFEKQLPLAQGGLLLVLGGTDSAPVDRAFSALGLAGTRVVGCGADDVVAWAPGVDNAGAAPLEAALRASAPGAKVKDRELIEPQQGEPERKPKRD